MLNKIPVLKAISCMSVGLFVCFYLTPLNSLIRKNVEERFSLGFLLMNPKLIKKPTQVENYQSTISMKHKVDKHLLIKIFHLMFYGGEVPNTLHVTTSLK